MTNWTPQQRATGSLWALLFVLLLCWGQNSNWVSSCPLQAQHQVQDAVASANSALAQDCDLSSQLLQQAHLQVLDSVAIGILLVVLIVSALLQQQARHYYDSPPFIWRYRRHLHFCVFRE
jgi:hypothetical protein